MIVTVMKTTNQKLDPEITHYRDYNTFCNDSCNAMKYLRGNNMSFMNKSLSRTFMRRSQLRCKYHKKRSETNILAYAKQRNFCVFLLRKTKKDHYANLNEKDIADKK